MDNMENLKSSRIVTDEKSKRCECCTLLTFCFYNVNKTSFFVDHKSPVVCNHSNRQSLSWINGQENAVFINVTKCNILSG